MSNKFGKTDDLKADFDREKKRMDMIKRFLNTYKNGLAKQITYHSMKHDTKKNQILQSEIYGRLNDMEKKLVLSSNGNSYAFDSVRKALEKQHGSMSENEVMAAVRIGQPVKAKVKARKQVREIISDLTRQMAYPQGCQMSKTTQMDGPDTRISCMQRKTTANSIRHILQK